VPVVVRVDAEWIPTAIEAVLKAKLGEAAEDGAVWLGSDEGKEWQQERNREARERLERAKTWGVRQAEWGEPPAVRGEVGMTSNPRLDTTGERRGKTKDPPKRALSQGGTSRASARPGSFPRYRRFAVTRLG
jgi:hypothetical protein